MALPCELIDEILCCLPVKPLLRFRCVSKGWCSLIDSTPFVKKHLRKSLECNSGGRLIIDGGIGENFYLAENFESDLDVGNADAVEIKDPLKTLLSGATIVGAANGLVCVSKDTMNELLVFNPSTRKSKKMPTAPADFPRFFHMADTSLCGFGYDPVNDDYKVVKIADCYLPWRGILVIVYSLKTNSWKWIQNVPSNNTRFFGDRGMFASGALHWLAIKNPANCHRIVVGFDLGLEQFKEVPFPSIKRLIVNFTTTGLLSDGESLFIVDNYPNSHIDVWLMNNHSRDENLWSKALSVEQRGILGSFRFFRPVAFSKSGDSVLLEVDGPVVDKAKLLWYDLKRKTVNNVKIRGIPNKFNSYVYTENLIQLTEDKSLQRPQQDRPEKKQKKRRDDFLSKGFKLRL